MTLTLFATIITVTVYLSVFAFYGDEIFDTDWSVDECTGIGCFFSTVSNALETLGDLLQFITLTNLPEVPVMMELFLKFIVGLPWLIIITGLVRGTAAS